MAAKRTMKSAVSKTERKEFSKKQLLSSKKFIGRKDVLEAVLSDDKTYTVEEAEQEISKYMKGKVK